MEAHGTKFMIFLLQRDSNFFNFTEFIRITFVGLTKIKLSFVITK